MLIVKQKLVIIGNITRTSTKCNTCVYIRVGFSVLLYISEPIGFKDKSTSTPLAHVARRVQLLQRPLCRDWRQCTVLVGKIRIERLIHNITYYSISNFNWFCHQYFFYKLWHSFYQSWEQKNAIIEEWWQYATRLQINDILILSAS